MSIKNHTMGYMPDETPTFGRLVLYAIQQVIVMFPATITVALITGFQVSTTIFASGLATLCFILITGKKIPLYYGSSFAYLTAIASMCAAKGYVMVDGILPQIAIQEAQFGIIMSGLVSIAAGVIVKFFGHEAIEKLLPASITGTISCVIGLTLAGNALTDAIPMDNNSYWLIVSLVTLLSTVIYARYLKGLLGQLPLLLGALTGCLVAAIFYFGFDINLFRAVPSAALEASIWKLGNGSIFALPAITFPKFSLDALFAIMPIAIATIPESTAHIYQLDIYVNDVAKEKGREKVNLVKYLYKNLIGDGICDMIAGVVGGPAGTNYGENISTMAITRVFSVSVLVAASILAMVVSCFTPLIKIIYGIPLAVIGGLEIYLFGAIAAQGIAIMIDKKVSMFDSKNIAVIAVVMVVGLGGNYAFGGNIPFFGLSIPCIAGAALAGIFINWILSFNDNKQVQ